MAMAAGSFRRTTRTARTKESGSGSSSAFSTASWIRLRMAKLGHHEAVELLADEVRRLAAQDDPGAPQMGLEFVQCGLDFPALMIEGRQLMRWRRVVVADRGEEPIDRFGAALQAVVDRPHREPAGPVAAIPFRAIDGAQVRAVEQSSVGDQAHVLLDAPEQLGPAAARQGPQRETEEPAVRQAQHTGLQPAEHRASISQ